MLKTTRLLSLVALLCLLAGAAPPDDRPSQSRTDDGSTLTVMTFNIRYGTASDGENAWPKRRQLVFDVLARHDPDVVGLQEALRFQLDEIRAALPHYAEIGVGRKDGKTGGEYAAILYRADRFDVDEHGTFWLSETPEEPGSKSWGNSITRICTWVRLIDKPSGRGFYIFNTHLDHRSQPSREKSAILIAQRLADRSHRENPVILTGDFNAAEDNTAIRYLTGKMPRTPEPEIKGARHDEGAASGGGEETPSEGEAATSGAPPPITLVDTFRTKHPDATNVGTFNAFKGTRSGGKIDFIFIEPGAFDVLDAAIVCDNDDSRYPSDHFPVIARLRSRPGRERSADE